MSRFPDPGPTGPTLCAVPTYPHAVPGTFDHARPKLPLRSPRQIRRLIITGRGCEQAEQMRRSQLQPSFHVSFPPMDVAEVGGSKRARTNGRGISGGKARGPQREATSTAGAVLRRTRLTWIQRLRRIGYPGQPVDSVGAAQPDRSTLPHGGSWTSGLQVNLWEAGLPRRLGKPLPRDLGGGKGRVDLPLIRSRAGDAAA
jgi:hypothetical protein